MRNGLSEVLKYNKHNDLEDMVITMNLTYCWIEKLLNIGFDLQLYKIPEGFYKIVDNKNILPSFITVTIDDIGLGTLNQIHHY